MPVDPLWIIPISTSIALGYYSIITKYLEKDFVSRYGKLKSAFDDWMRNESKSFAGDMKKKLKEGAGFDDLSDYMYQWNERQIVARKLRGDYDALHSASRWALYALAGSFLLAVIGVFTNNALIDTQNTQNQYRWSDASFFFLFIGVAIIFYYVVKHSDLSARISKFELGTPITQFVDEQIETEETSND